MVKPDDEGTTVVVDDRGDSTVETVSSELGKLDSVEGEAEDEVDFKVETLVKLEVVGRVVCVDFFDLDLMELLCDLFWVVARCVRVFVDLCIGCLNVFVSVKVEKMVLIISN